MGASMNTEMLYIRSMPPHYHEDQLELLLVLEGTVTVHRMERQTVLHEGEFTFINRRIVHYITSEGAYVLSTRVKLKEFRHVYERIEYVEFMNHDENPNTLRPLRWRLNAIVVDLILQDYRYCRNPELAAEKEFYETQLVDFIFCSYQLAACLRTDAGFLNDDLTDRFYMVAEYIMEHVREKIMVEDIMKLVYMNPAYFSQFMKKAGGVGFKDFFMYRKLMVVSMLLLDEQYSVNEIASMVDLTDMKAFYHMFKKYYRISPARWREQLRQIPEDYQVCDRPEVLEAFKQGHWIDKRQDSGIAHLYQYMAKCKKDGISLKDVDVVLKPYAGMPVINPYYQPYKYFGALIHLIQNVGARLVMTYPLWVLQDENHYQLTVQALESFAVAHGIGEVRRWKIVIEVGLDGDMRKAQAIQQNLMKQTDLSNVNVRILS